MKQNKIFETHCHLDYFESDIDTTLASCEEVGVDRIITIAVSPDNLDKVITLSNNHSQVYCSQGIHPHEAKNVTDETYQKIEYNLKKNSKVIAIGECGLDYHYDFSPRAIQQEVFERQLQIACENDLPVVIHTREADDDTLLILKNFSSKLKRKGVLHSYTSSLELAEWALSENFYLGFNGIITFKNAQNVRDILEATPIDQILTETDAPYLSPIPMRGKQNRPFYLPYVLQKIMEIKQTEDAGIFYQNAMKLFQLSVL